MFIKLFMVLPITFYAPVLALSFLLIVWMATQLATTKARIRKLRVTLLEIEDAIRMHQGCQIENLPLISEIFEFAPRKLAIAYEDMIQTSIDLYQKKWIPNPQDFISIHTILDNKTAKRLKDLGFLYFTLVGILMSVLSLIYTAAFFETADNFSDFFLIASIPSILSMLFTLLFFLERSENYTTAQNSISSLIRSLSKKLPVFNDYNGLALLINQFLEYDRNMNNSVEKLCSQIDRFVMDGLKNAVTESIERTLLESVSPSIERATNAIVILSQDVVEKQENGMKDLAVKFSTALSEELFYQLEPLVKQIEEVSNTLSNSKNYLDIASMSLDTYKKNAIELQSLTSKTLLEYEESKALFSDDIHIIAGAFEHFSKTASDYIAIVSTNQKSFEDTAKALNRSMDESHIALRTLLEGIFAESMRTQEQANESQINNESYLRMMKSQIDLFSDEFATRNKELLDGLSTTMTDFVNKQSSNLMDQQSNVSIQSVSMLESMEKATKDISICTRQIRISFEELEAARHREEEIARNKKPGLFGRK